MHSFAPPTFAPPIPRQRKRGLKVGKKLKMIEELYCGLPADQGGEETFLFGAACAGISKEKALAHFRLALRLMRRGK